MLLLKKIKLRKKHMQNFKNEIINSSLVKVRETFLQKIVCEYTKSLSIIKCKIITRIFFIVLK